MREVVSDPRPQVPMSPSARVCGALLALAVLSMGVLVYIVDRPAGSAIGLPGGFLHSGNPMGLFGSLGTNLPSFAHAFAFSLGSCLFLPRLSLSVAAIARCCFSWALLETVFECLQHPALGRPVVAMLRRLFMPGSAADTAAGYFANYFANGRFDPLDVVAGVLGAAASLAVAALWLANQTHQAGGPAHN